MKRRILFLLLTLIARSVLADGHLPDPEYFKVCADPHMLPMSNQDGEGYENKIAELLANKLGLKLKYEFFPQRMGFIRNTLRAESNSGPGPAGYKIGYKCDIVINVPSGFELAATTDPYYTTSYALVYAKGRNLDSVTDPMMLLDAVKTSKDKIKIGLSDIGAAQLWVFYNELMSYMTPYQGQPGDPKANPNKILIDEVVAGNIDATIVMGQTAGYWAKQYKDKVELVVLPLKDDPKKKLRLTYSFSMAVRYKDKAWKETINKLIKENKTEIEDILIDYNIPLIK
jgi:quinoprotein dehydrogenase-associated probable ABC transporter substrate-binding protein